MEQRAYPSDLTDEQWALLAPLVERPRRADGRGRPRDGDLRRVVTAILSVLRAGCRWRPVPPAFPAWQTVYWYCTQWTDDGTLLRVPDALRRAVREQADRDRDPSAVSIDAQSVKTSAKGGMVATTAARSCRAANGSLPSITEGGLSRGAALRASVPAGDGVSDRCTLAQPVCPRVTAGWVDQRLRPTVDPVAARFGWTLAVVTKPPGQAGFAVQPRRWVVERAFGWLGACRRLSKHYEELVERAERGLSLALIRLLLRRLAPP